jgi:broad specificity phosphatase PhoE
VPPTAVPTCRRIFLVRHGETLYGGASEGALPGGDLTEQGYRQIESLAELLHDVQLDAIYSSPLGRATATARTLAGASGVAITTIDDLREIVPGEITGKEMAQIFAAVRTFFANPATDWDTPYLGGETYRDLRARVWPLFQSLLADQGWQRVAVVAHGGVNNAVLGHVLGASGPSLVNIEQDFGCLNIIDVVGGRPILRLANFTAYDPAKTGMETSSMDILRGVLESGLQLSLDIPEEH